MKDKDSIIRIINNTQTKYQHNSEVEILRGYYKGYRGKIVSYEHIGNELYYTINVQLPLTNEPMSISIKETEIKKVIRPFWKK